MSAPRKIVADSAILEDLRSAAARNGGKLSRRAFAKLSSVGLHVVCQRFGTWSEALLAAGVESSRPVVTEASTQRRATRRRRAARAWSNPLVLEVSKRLGRTPDDVLRVCKTPFGPIVCARGYHANMLRRARALIACGRADYLKCRYCGQYDSPSALIVYAIAKTNSTTQCHAACQAAYQSARSGSTRGRHNRSRRDHMYREGRA